MVARNVSRRFALVVFLPLVPGCAGATEHSEPVSASVGSQTNQGGTSLGGSSGGSAGVVATDGGGTAGTDGGGSGAAAGVGGASTFRECTNDADCVVLGDCCACQAVPIGTVSRCPLDCAANRCLDLPEAPVARCIFGQCVLSVSCYFPPLQPVTCGQKPSCPSGQVPSAPGGCYGPCIAATECLQVTSCADCAAPDQMCVFEQGAAGIAHCLEKPASCFGVPNCACMVELCNGLPCAEIENGISCGDG